MTATLPSAIERRPFLKLAAGALATAAAACRDGSDRAYARGNTLIAGVDIYDKGALNPDELPSTLMFLPLVRVDERGERQPCLAASWEHSADYLEWTYHLRPGVRWHDGVSVTADDVKRTVDVWAHFGFMKGAICTVHDAATVSVRGTEWAKGFDTTITLLPNHLVKDLNPERYYQWDFWLRPVGNGPYRFLRRQPKTMVELEANPDYYKGRPRIERVILKFVQAAGLTELLGGNVDAIEVEDTAQLPAVAHDRRFRVYWRPKAGWLSMLTIVWQNEHPLFREADVRRALSLGINREELAQILDFPRQSTFVDGLYTERQLRRGEAAAPTFEPVEAARLLDAAGWRQPNRDGLRGRNGQVFRFTALTTPGLLKAAVDVQAQLRKLGVSMELQPLNSAVLKGRVKTRNFEACFCSPPGIWDRLDLLRDGSQVGYRNPRLTTLLDAAEATADPDAVEQAYRGISEILRADQPVTFLTRPAKAYVVHRRVKGLSAPWHADPLWYIDELSLDDRNEA
jgi:peptide/nickel transport system substrate-binding protein